MRFVALVFPVFACASALTLVAPSACSNGDDAGSSLAPPSKPGQTYSEAGSNCSTTENCEPGLVCLYPVAACNTLPVCVVPPEPEGGACAQPQVACSCIGELIPVCNGYATSAVDPTSTCEGGTVIVPLDSGTDATVAPGADGGVEAGPDASSGGDASDASGD